MVFEDLLLRLGIIYGLILFGAVLKRSVKDVDTLTKMLSALLVNLLFPIVVFISITQSTEAIRDFRISLSSVSIYLFSSVLAYVVLRGLGQRGKAAGPFILASVLLNGFYLPFPIVYALYGVEGASYSTIHLLIANVVTAFYVYPLYSYYSTTNQRPSKLVRKVLLFPPFVASILGFLYLGLGFTFPERLVQPVSYFGQLTTYLALVFVGLNISLEGKNWFSKPTISVAIIRLLALPLIFFGLMKSLGLKEVWSMAIIIYAGMPPAINNIILADHFGLDKKLMATIVTVATVLTLLTLPMLIYLGGCL